MKISNVSVRPRKLADGMYTLEQIVWYDERVPGMPWLNRSERKVWPPCKQPNKRGKKFATYEEAVAFFVENMESEVKYSDITRAMVERYGNRL